MECADGAAAARVGRVGDLELQPFISPEPDVSVVALPPPGDGGGPCVLILASDGLWGLLDDDEAAQIATPLADEPQAAAEALVREAARRGGADNMSVVVVRL